METLFERGISAVTLKRRSRHAEDCTKSIQQSLKVETNLSVQSCKSDKGAINSLKALKNMHIALMLPQDGDTILLPHCIRLHVRHHDGSQAAIWSTWNWDPWNFHCGVHSVFYRSICVFFSLARNLISWQSTGWLNSTPSAHTFISCAFCQRACPSLLSQLTRYMQPRSHALIPRTAWLKHHGAHSLCLAPKQSHFIAPCHMLHLT